MNVYLFLTPGARNNSCQCAVTEAVALGTAVSEYVHRDCLLLRPTAVLSVVFSHKCAPVSLPRKVLLIPVNRVLQVEMPSCIN